VLPVTDTPQTGNLERPGPTLVASHSFSFSRREWVEASDVLSDRFRTVAVDAPGHGDAHDVTGYPMAEMATRFAETVNELGLTNYVLIGHSMTGKIMQILASKAGAGLGLANPPAKMVLITPTPLGPEVGHHVQKPWLASVRNRADAGAFVRDRSVFRLRRAAGLEATTHGEARCQWQKSVMVGNPC
jgi:pimeloyl-ACP methyl ester carboxylesterase